MIGKRQQQSLDRLFQDQEQLLSARRAEAGHQGDPAAGTEPGTVLSGVVTIGHM